MKVVVVRVTMVGVGIVVETGMIVGVRGHGDSSDGDRRSSGGSGCSGRSSSGGDGMSSGGNDGGSGDISRGGTAGVVLL